MAVRDFLRNLSYRGQGLSDVGNVDVLSGSYLTRNFPLAFASLLQESSRPGGYLSSLGQDRVFSGQLDALAEQEQQRMIEGERALGAAGLNPAMARRMMAEDQIRSQRMASALRGESERDLQQRTFQAGSELAKILAQAEVQEKQALQQEEHSKRLRKILKKGQKLQKIGLGLRALQLVPGVGGLLGGLGKAIKGAFAPSPGQAAFQAFNPSAGGVPTPSGAFFGQGTSLSQPQVFGGGSVPLYGMEQSAFGAVPSAGALQAPASNPFAFSQQFQEPGFYQSLFGATPGPAQVPAFQTQFGTPVGGTGYDQYFQYLR